MVELERALRSLGERPDRPPTPVEELERRVLARQRRRTRQRVAAATALLLLIGAIPVLASWRERDTVVETGPVERPPLPVVTEAPRPPAVQADIPPGWETLLADGDMLVVGTRRLDERDLRLAVLARDDATFGAFPSDGVVFVVGRDRLTAKYTLGEVGRLVSNGVEVVQGGSVGSPGPANGLGPEKVLPGGVRVRRGDVPQSGVVLAAYSGPAAPGEVVSRTEAIAASVRITPASGPTPPPPPGSRPGFDSGQPQVPEDRMRKVTATVVNRVELSLHVGDGCAIVRGLSNQAIAGGCTERRPDAGSLAVVAATSALGLPPSPVLPPPPGAAPPPPAAASQAQQAPGGDRVMVVVARAGTGVRAVKALLVDGTRVDAFVDADGWLLVGSPGRVYLLEGYDAGGRMTGQTAVS